MTAGHTAWALQMRVLHPTVVRQFNKGHSKSGTEFIAIAQVIRCVSLHSPFFGKRRFLLTEVVGLRRKRISILKNA